jgi:hypothetical protein
MKQSETWLAKPPFVATVCLDYLACRFPFQSSSGNWETLAGRKVITPIFDTSAEICHRSPATLAGV